MRPTVPNAIAATRARVSPRHRYRADQDRHILPGFLRGVWRYLELRRARGHWKSAHRRLRLIAISVAGGRDGHLSFTRRL